MNNPLPTISFSEMRATMDYHVKSSPQSSPVDTAKAGILSALQNLEHGNITIPMFHHAITAILEALYQDGVQAGRDTERKVRP